MNIFPTTIVAAHPTLIRAFPSAVMIKGTIYCAYLQATAHQPNERDQCSIRICSSTNGGYTWVDDFIASSGLGDANFLNAPALSNIDGKLHLCYDICDRPSRQFFSSPPVIKHHSYKVDKHSIEQEYIVWCDLRGMVPSASLPLGDSVVLASHTDPTDEDPRWRVSFYDWGGVNLADFPRCHPLRPCEAALFYLDNSGDTFGILLRENTHTGHRALKAWSTLAMLRRGHFMSVSESSLQGCHRPAAGLLDADNLLVTYRYYPGYGASNRNTFGAILSTEGFTYPGPDRERATIFPIHFDTTDSDETDQGYTSWVDAGEEIVVLNYVMGDLRRQHIVAHHIPRAFFKPLLAE